MSTATAPGHVFVPSKQAYRGPDPGLVHDQMKALIDMRRKYGPGLFSAQMLWILRKNPEPGEKDLLPKDNKFWNRRLIPFVHNRIQRDLDEKLIDRNILLKPRQIGSTTYFINERLLVPATTEPGVGCLLISQNNHYATHHFTILKRALKFYGAYDPTRLGDSTVNVLYTQLHENLLHTSATNRKEVIFDQLDSRVLCDSAEIEEVGQGLTIQHLVATEVARWPGNPEETLANVKEAIPTDGTVDLESTANMMEGYFYEECERARQAQVTGEDTEFRFHFHPWWWQDEYRIDLPAERLVKIQESLKEDEETLVRSFNIDLQQIAWRRKKFVQLRHNFREKYPEDPVTCFLLQGTGYFDAEIVGTRLQELTGFQPYSEFKKLIIYKKRIVGRRYVIGADVAQGKITSTNNPDYSTAYVQELESGEICARYMARIAPEVFGWDLADLGKLYNNAIIAVERNFDGGSVLLTLEVSCQYTNLYKHKEWWKRERKVIEMIGFPTTSRTRPVALNRARFLIENSPDLVPDIELCRQALQFIINEKGKPEAKEGAHDDLVMALAISNYVRLVLLGYLDALTIPSERYTSRPDEEYEEEPGEEE